MKKFTVLFFTLLAFIVSNSMALAQDNATKKRPAPIERAHIDETTKTIFCISNLLPYADTTKYY